MEIGWKYNRNRVEIDLKYDGNTLGSGGELVTKGWVWGMKGGFWVMNGNRKGWIDGFIPYGS